MLFYKGAIMINIGFDFDVSGLEDAITQEVKEINEKIPIALENVGSGMIIDLKKHIEEDFYKQYSPVAYRRRYERGLLNPENINAVAKGFNLHFSYNPQGTPTGILSDSLNWSDDLESWLKTQHKSGNSPFFSNVHSGIDLIEWASKEHEIGDYKIPARPFWDNFADEQENEKIMDNFISGMLPYEVKPLD